jgi:hypothetical protein
VERDDHDQLMQLVWRADAIDEWRDNVDADRILSVASSKAS